MDITIKDSFASVEECNRIAGFHLKMYPDVEKAINTEVGHHPMNPRFKDGIKDHPLWNMVYRIKAWTEAVRGPRLKVESVFTSAITRAHLPHADNTEAVCKRHGKNALSCKCPDVVLQPNHTAWRDFTTIMYLTGNHVGGQIIIGENYPRREPDEEDRLYLQAKPGRLLGFPSDAKHYHRTRAVDDGLRMAMLVWFTLDQSRAMEGL